MKKTTYKKRKSSKVRRLLSMYSMACVTAMQIHASPDCSSVQIIQHLRTKKITKIYSRIYIASRFSYFLHLNFTLKNCQYMHEEKIFQRLSVQITLQNVLFCSQFFSFCLSSLWLLGYLCTCTFLFLLLSRSSYPLSTCIESNIKVLVQQSCDIIDHIMHGVFLLWGLFCHPD